MPSVCLIYLTFGFLCLFYVEKVMIRKKPSRHVFHSAYERVGVKVSFRRAVFMGPPWYCCRLGLFLREPQFQGVGLLRNGVFREHSRAATAVAESHHCSVDVQIYVVLGLEVAVVSNSRELLLRIWQSREREQFAIGCSDCVAFALFCSERERCRLFVVAARLRTWIVYIFLCHAACPSADGSCLKTVNIAVLQSSAVP